MDKGFVFKMTEEVFDVAVANRNWDLADRCIDEMSALSVQKERLGKIFYDYLQFRNTVTRNPN